MATAMFVSGEPTQTNVQEAELAHVIVEEHIAEQHALINDNVKPTSYDVEAYIQNYFSDVPVMRKIAWCESRNTQFLADGSVIRGWQNPADVGAFQVNETYHKQDAVKLGFDLHTLEGNAAYARHLYLTQGTAPWIYSQPCWGNDLSYEQLAVRE